MKIKKTTYYALCALRMIYLDKEQIVTSNCIAKSEGISQGVVIKILRILNKEGILNVYRGRGSVCGGFSLNKSIDEITLLEIVEIMEGVNICENLDKELEEKENRLFLKCSQINEHFRAELSKYTIRELFEL